MKAIMVMYDSLNRHYLEPYGCTSNRTPNFTRLAERTATFDNCWVGSMPCMPARRELHTGRYNFLHRSWGPLEPFDDSAPEILRNAGIHTHLVSDHYHYWEDSGATYHQRYTTWQNVRGQEGDAWAPLVRFDDIPEQRNGEVPTLDNYCGQDFANRSLMQDEAHQSQTVTFDGGLEFLERNHEKDNWFLQIETFDPHEPFFVQPEFKAMYPDHYKGPVKDWPGGRPLNDQDDPELIEHLRCQYRALTAMCDKNLGRVLDAMDRYDLWKDTMLIVNTDHGFLLGEHNMMGKCHCPFFGEVAHTPLFIWDPRSRRAGVRRKALVQTIDLPATLLEYFGMPLPGDMQGRPLKETVESDQPVRKAALFGIFGGQICCTDGDWTYYKAASHPEKPRYEYTLFPTTLTGTRHAFFSDEELKTAQMAPPLPFTKGLPVMRLQQFRCLSESQNTYPTMLVREHREDGTQEICENKEQQTRMEEQMKKLMRENDCPPHVFERYFD